MSSDKELQSKSKENCNCITFGLRPRHPVPILQSAAAAIGTSRYYSSMRTEGDIQQQGTSARRSINTYSHVL